MSDREHTEEGETVMALAEDPGTPAAYVVGVMPNDRVRLELWGGGKLLAFLELDERDAEHAADLLKESAARLRYRRTA